MFFNLSYAQNITSTTVSAQSPNYNYDMLKLVNLVKTSKPDFPFAAMIIDNSSGKILCINTNQNDKALNLNIHAEIMTIYSCAKKYKNINWQNTTLITTAAPCAMCMGTIIYTGISKVVYGTSISYLNKHYGNQIEINPEKIAQKSQFNKVTVIGGVMASQTNLLYNLQG
ncbi:MAG: cytidine/deoxycytidylate deaminase [Pseudomonadota bacterium]|nr:nucleoside deaminase [Burkholderiales bacterium]